MHYHSIREVENMKLNALTAIRNVGISGLEWLHYWQLLGALQKHQRTKLV
jgi:hypothetical protein